MACDIEYRNNNKFIHIPRFWPTFDYSSLIQSTKTQPEIHMTPNQDVKILEAISQSKMWRQMCLANDKSHHQTYDTCFTSSKARVHHSTYLPMANFICMPLLCSTCRAHGPPIHTWLEYTTTHGTSHMSLANITQIPSSGVSLVSSCYLSQPQQVILAGLISPNSMVNSDPLRFSIASRTTDWLTCTSSARETRGIKRCWSSSSVPQTPVSTLL